MLCALKKKVLDIVDSHFLNIIGVKDEKLFTKKLLRPFNQNQKQESDFINFLGFYRFLVFNFHI